MEAFPGFVPLLSFHTSHRRNREATRFGDLSIGNWIALLNGNSPISNRNSLFGDEIAN